MTLWKHKPLEGSHVDPAYSNEMTGAPPPPPLPPPLPTAKQYGALPVHTTLT